MPSEPLTSKEVDNRRKNAERLKRIINYIDSHLGDKISQSEIAKNEGVTTTHLSHLFKEGLGINFQDYLNERRLERAIQLMRSSSKGMIDISYESGFSDPKYMSRLFQKRFGCSPKEFKNKNILYPITLGHRDEAILERIFSESEAIHYLTR